MSSLFVKKIILIILLDFCNFDLLHIFNIYLLIQNMEKKLKHYAIEPEVSEQLIEWGLQSRKEGMKGAGKSRRAQLRFVCTELLDIAKKQEKNLQPIIQRDFSGQVSNSTGE